MTRITVLFSTLNGAHTLPRMLDSLERLRPPAGGWQVVAVDNGSADRSPAILEERVHRLPMRLVEEPRRGKNAALNAGLALVEGDIVALTDDDVILPEDWLLSIERAAAQQPGYDIFGGAVVPVWEECPPAWVLRCVPKGLLSLTDFPEGPVGPYQVWGGSMAVRAAVFDKHRFHEDIGPDGSRSYAMGSEGEFVVRAAKGGHRCWHFRESPVGHIIRPYQLDPEWLLQRRYNLGRGLRRIRRLNEEKGWPGSPIRPVLGLVNAARVTAAAAGGVAIARLLGNSDSRFQARLRLRHHQGDFAERLAELRGEGAAERPRRGGRGRSDTRNS